MKVNIIGDGSFGSFLKELMPRSGFTLSDSAENVILAVPISAYEELTHLHSRKYIVNVCSVQKPSMDIILKINPMVTGLHPLFGRRTPHTERNSILTHECGAINEYEFLHEFNKISKFWDVCPLDGLRFTPESHDKLMFDTHVAAVRAAEQARPFVEAAKKIPNEFVPHSFRLLREFVKTLDDMPAGTMESIMANPFIKNEKN